MIDLVGVGNLNIDTFVFVEDSFIEKQRLRKGNAHPKKKYHSILEKIKDHKKENHPGGSVANTLSGAHNLGIECLLSGILGNDKLGEFYLNNVATSGMHHKISLKEGKSSNCICMITPDKQRTFATAIGMADKYQKQDLPYDAIKKDVIFHTETYTLEGPGKDVILDFIKYSKEKKAKTSLDIGYAAYAEKERPFLIELLEKEIDFVFCNEEEAIALAQMNTYDSLDFLGELCETAVVTVGEVGALIKNKGRTYKIPGYNSQVVDTTGAGDAFRAGFFYGYFKTGDMEKAGKMGCYYSSKVVENVGARLNEKIENIEDKI